MFVETCPTVMFVTDLKMADGEQLKLFPCAEI